MKAVVTPELRVKANEVYKRISAEEFTFFAAERMRQKRWDMQDYIREFREFMLQHPELEKQPERTVTTPVGVAAPQSVNPWGIAHGHMVDPSEDADDEDELVDVATAVQELSGIDLAAEVEKARKHVSTVKSEGVRWVFNQLADMQPHSAQELYDRMYNGSGWKTNHDLRTVVSDVRDELEFAGVQCHIPDGEKFKAAVYQIKPGPRPPKEI